MFFFIAQINKKRLRNQFHEFFMKITFRNWKYPKVKFREIDSIYVWAWIFSP